MPRNVDGGADKSGRPLGVVLGLRFQVLILGDDDFVFVQIALDIVVRMIDIVVVVKVVCGQKLGPALVGVNPSQGGRRWDQRGEFLGRLEEHPLRDGCDEERFPLAVNLLGTSLLVRVCTYAFEVFIN